jgi:hypothetical protein
MGGAVLAATRRTWIATLGLRELQDVLQEEQREHRELDTLCKSGHKHEDKQQSICMLYADSGYGLETVSLSQPA